MTVHEVTASGHEALMLATRLLQRARLAAPEAGQWEAADVQWWWRRSREPDAVEQLFWVDDDGPVAMVLLTCWSGTWQCDAVKVTGVSSVAAEHLWARTQGQIERHVVGVYEVPVWDGDEVLLGLVIAAGLVPDETSRDAWLAPADRPGPRPLPHGFSFVDRSDPRSTPHPMRSRNGDEVEQRLREAPLYDPALDLAVETADGEVAAYSLYWHDPVTGVGMVEPVRVEDAFQRLGLATAMLAEGLDRLARRGAQRLKIGYGTEAAGAVYTGIGFRPAGLLTAYVDPTRQASASTT